MNHAQAPHAVTVPVTADQIAAYNLRHWRRAAGLTQKQAGARLGWTEGNLSEVERSWDPARLPRRLDAQTLTEMALALGVPLTAFFLPPPDDGTGARYLLAAGGRHYAMSDLMALAVMPDNDDDTPVMTAYRDRYNTAAARYLDPEWAAVAGRWLRDGAGPQARADVAARLTDQRAALLAAAELLGELAAAVSAPDGTP
jgi:transcriptional regulator with XRE-family HTH domain